MTVQIKTSRRFLSAALAMVLGGALLAGCGGAGRVPSASTSRPTTSTLSESARLARENAELGVQPQPAGDKDSAKNAATARRDKAACEQAVQSAPALAAAAKSEIAGLCFRINYIPEDNERTVRSICQEVANASPLTSEAARKRTATACYAAAMK